MTKWRLNHLRQHYMFPNDVQQDTLVQMHYQAGMVLPHTEPAWGLCCGNAAIWGFHQETRSQGEFTFARNIIIT